MDEAVRVMQRGIRPPPDTELRRIYYDYVDFLVLGGQEGGPAADAWLKAELRAYAKREREKRQC